MFGGCGGVCVCVVFVVVMVVRVLGVVFVVVVCGGGGVYVCGVVWCGVRGGGG